MMKQNKMEEQWLNEIRQTLANREEELPADGWEKLAAAMASAKQAEPATPSPQPLSPRIIPMWMKRAAVVLLLATITAGGVYYFADAPENSSVPITSAVKETSAEQAASAQSVVPLPILANTPKPELLAAHEAEHNVREESNAQEELAAEPHTAEPIISEPRQEPEPISNIHQEENAVLCAMEDASKQKSTVARPWTIGMRIVRNGSSDFDFEDTSSNYPNYPDSWLGSILPKDSTKEDALNKAQTRAANEALPDDVVSSENHTSWSAGITVSKPLNQYLALESGLVYTYLTSDVTLRQTGRQHQQLHYLGIPLKLTATISEEGCCRFYTSVGTMLEHSLYGQRGTKNLHLNDWQWSMDGGLGLQFKLSEHMGLYIEPGVNYYFSNGSDVPSLRTESPFSFNLQLGIRFGL